MLALFVIYLSVAGQISKSCIDTGAIFYESYVDSADKYALDFADGEYTIGYTRGYIPGSASDVYAAKEIVKSCSTNDYHCFLIQGVPFVVPTTEIVGNTFRTPLANVDVERARGGNLVYAIECSPITKPNCVNGAEKNRVEYKYTVNAENRITEISMRYIVNGKVVESHYMRKEDGDN